jgi:hypothetical protein
MLKTTRVQRLQSVVGKTSLFRRQTNKWIAASKEVPAEAVAEERTSDIFTGITESYRRQAARMKTSTRHKRQAA